MCRREEGQERRVRQVDRHVNVLEEEYFQFGWPQSARRVDERDAIHRHGRTYFLIHGQINGVTLSGAGRLPLVYAASRLHYPWIEIRFGQKLRAVDTKEGAVDLRPGQPHRGPLRRPAASSRVLPVRGWDCTPSTPSGVTPPSSSCRSRRGTIRGPTRPRVVVQSEPVALTYTIDMDKDLVDRLESELGRGDRIVRPSRESSRSPISRMRIPRRPSSQNRRSSPPGL